MRDEPLWNRSRSLDLVAEFAELGPSRRGASTSAYDDSLGATTNGSCVPSSLTAYWREGPLQVADQAEASDAMARLYVIGNGFDLHHGIPSSYRAFGRFVRNTDPDTFEKAEQFLFSDEELWADFENNLAGLEPEDIIEEAGQFLVSYGAEDWSDAYHHDYQNAIEEITTALSAGLHQLFVRWLTTLPSPNVALHPVNIDQTALFLNFNYTPTLQNLYGVPAHNVLHIHGRLGGAPADIILGHGWELPPPRRPRIDNLNEDDDFDDRDTRIVEGEAHINTYFKKTFKPTAQILKRHAATFQALSNIDEVWVMGHSMSDVDQPYFAALRDSVAPGARWKISYYDVPTLDALKIQVCALGLTPAQVQFEPLDRF